ncbi:MAG: hypothetical protein ABW150_18755 [Candidatus Thiodiazotropha sp.]
MSGKLTNLFDWEGMMEDPTRRGLLGMGMGLLGSSGYSRVPVSLGQALSRGFLQGLDQSGQAHQARLAVDAQRAAQAEAAAKRAKAEFEQELMLERFGFEKAKFAHTQAKDARLAALQDRMVKHLAPSVVPASVPPSGVTGSPASESVRQPGEAFPSAFPLTAEQAMAMKAVGLPDFTDDVAADRRLQLDKKKFAHTQAKDARDFDYKRNEKRIDQLREKWQTMAEMPTRYQRLLDAEALLDEGIYSGSWPERLVHSLKNVIPMDREGLARTEAFVSLMGREALEVVKQLGSGTAISDADRIYAQEIAGGSLETSERGLRKILAIAKREMARTGERWNTQLPNRLKGMEDYFPEDLRVRLPGQGGQGSQPKAPEAMTNEELNKTLGL